MNDEIKNFITNLLRQNFTTKTIRARCLKKDWSVTDIEIATIKKELDKQIRDEQIKENIKNKQDEKGFISLFTELETYFDFAKRIGVNIEYANTGELISVVQKITADIFIKQSVCYLRALELQSQGTRIDTSIFIKGYDIALRSLCLAWGIDKHIDVNAAFQCLESKGYLKDNHALSSLSQIHNN